MEPWYDLEDVHRLKGGKEPYNKYRVQLRKTMAMHMRERRLDQTTPGRPTLRTFIDRTGAFKVLGPLIPAEQIDRHLQQASVPMRLTDAARQNIVSLGVFSTAGLEEPPRNVNRELFLEIVKQKTGGDSPLLEYDFDPL